MSNAFRDDREAALAQAEALRRENEPLREEVAALREENARLRAGLPVPPRPAPRARSWVPAFVLASTALLLLVVGAGALVFTRAATTPPPPPAVSFATPPRPAAPDPPPPPVAPEPPAAPPPESSAGAGDIPTRAQIIAAMTGVRRQVAECARDVTGVVHVSATFASTGRVSRVEVAPPHAATRPGACIARAVRGVALPPFTRESFTVSFPYALR